MHSLLKVQNVKIYNYNIYAFVPARYSIHTLQPETHVATTLQNF
jgi:hypothetical protein